MRISNIVKDINQLENDLENELRRFSSERACFEILVGSKWEGTVGKYICAELYTTDLYITLGLTDGTTQTFPSAM